jgi:hypothetical protein
MGHYQGSDVPCILSLARHHGNLEKAFQRGHTLPANISVAYWSMVPS